MTSHRGRRRAPKNFYNTDLHSPVSSFPQNTTKQLPIGCQVKEIRPQWAKKKRSESRIRNYKNFSSSSSLSSESSTTWISKIEIPGPVPDLDALVKDESLFVDFFSNIPTFED